MSAAPLATGPILPGLPFTGPFLLAPMEGVTEPSFRDLVLELYELAEFVAAGAGGAATGLGGAFTEFVRVVDEPLKARVLAGHLGPRRYSMPVGLQLMGSNPAALAETAREAAALDVPLLDLNFGCPSRRALQGCAGSALLDDPSKLERLVAACARAVPKLPLSAKIRAGGQDDRRLEDLAKAVEQGGAGLLTVHCRTRSEGYADCADWRRLERAVAAVSIPVCGNGGVSNRADLLRLRGATGCRLAMVGRAALGDPWIFGDTAATPLQALCFLLEYAQRLELERGMGPERIAGRLKQLIAFWSAGELFSSQRQAWLGERDPLQLRARLGQLKLELVERFSAA